jgi:hypothetical protein
MLLKTGRPFSATRFPCDCQSKQLGPPAGARVGVGDDDPARDGGGLAGEGGALGSSVASPTASLGTSRPAFREHPTSENDMARPSAVATTARRDDVDVCTYPAGLSPKIV